jgi:DNA-binding transcriptional LysR family regulator
MDLPSIDLNLLVALRALLRERNVTRAGESIGLSQPATSAALARLRRHFGDELLARDGGRYVLTPLGASLLDQAEVALRYVEHTFAARPVFDARTSDREFTLIMSDYALAVLGVELFRQLEQQAPNVRLRILPTTIAAVDDASAALRTADLMVLPRGFLADLPSADLYRDRWVCVCAADNRLVGDTLTREDLGRLRWIVTYDSPTQFTPADKHLKLAGIERHADVVVENFLALPFLLAGTQRVCVLQQRLARKLQACGGIRILGLPVEIPELIEAAWWHPSRASDPGHRWLQQLVRAAAAALGDLDAIDVEASSDQLAGTGVDHQRHPRSR